MTQSRRRRQGTRSPWHPAAVPPTGFCLEQDGSRFEAMQVVPHARADAWLVTWRTSCAACGIGVMITCDHTNWQSLRRKRCERCRATELETAQANRAADGTP